MKRQVQVFAINLQALFANAVIEHHLADGAGESADESRDAPAAGRGLASRRSAEEVVDGGALIEHLQEKVYFNSSHEPLASLGLNSETSHPADCANRSRIT